MQGRRTVKRRTWRSAIAASITAFVALAAVYAGYLGWRVTRDFDQRGWDVPAQIYAAPMELYPGRHLTVGQLVVELERLGYRSAATLEATGTFVRSPGRIQVWTRAFATADGPTPSRRVDIRFGDSRIDAIEGESDDPIPLMQFDPMLIGSAFPAHGEDRIILAPEEVPELVIEALKAVEDRRFDEHFGIDILAIIRAALVNLRSGEIEQGGSTLTQQLVRSFYLSTERTWSRKLKEAFMAVALELEHSKQELMHAYVNEVYLAQEGTRAIHGFGLGSLYYFGKPLAELQLHELALLIAEIRGPSYYDPRRHPDRALARRNLVLSQMRERGLIALADEAAAASQPLGTADAASGRSSYYAGFLDLVRRQLRRDYAPEDLAAKGLKIFSTLDPSVQSVAEAGLVAEIDALEAGPVTLEAALVVTNPHNAEVQALVGSRDTRYDGFNRALDAHRPVGSLIKPAVYLAALESGSATLASLIDDAPIDVPLADGTTWSPGNFNDETHGPVTAVRALAESLNLATVRVGLDVGVDAVAETLFRLGLPRLPEPYPSLLLGAIDLTPFEVAQVYSTLANGGFRVPLRAVRAVVAADGSTLQRYRIEMAQAAEPAAVYALNQALVQVMKRGTGASVQRRLPDRLTTAGKTGTSDGLRDSWFAGFTAAHLVVAWVGNDDNRSIGLTGATGAGRVFSRVVANLDASPYAAPAPEAADSVWIDYNTGLRTDSRCADAVHIAMARRDLPPIARACGSPRARLGSRMRHLFRDALD
jgi:penicillin-binding protein 1B